MVGVGVATPVECGLRHGQQRPCSRRACWLPDGLHMHDLRYSGLTYVAHSGVTTKELMRRGGHGSPTAALRYRHEADGRDRAIADALG